MSATAAQNAIAVVGIDIGKNSFHIVALDDRGAIVLRQKWSRGQVEARFANMPPCLIGMEACVGAHHLSRKLKAFGHNARLMPAKYVRPYSKGQKNHPSPGRASTIQYNMGCLGMSALPPTPDVSLRGSELTLRPINGNRPFIRSPRRQ
jgi:transposase